MRKLLLAICVTAALGLPAVASAMPVDNGPAPPLADPAPTVAAAPQVRTIIRDTGNTLAIVVAGAALLVAVTTAGYSALRLAPLAEVRRASS
jgi:energy-converting hydrogenase Eha subunit A